MKRAKKSPEWRQFISKSTVEGFEVISRLGDPVVMHRKFTPFSNETVWFVFFAKRGKWSKSQLKGMEILEALGLHIFKYKPESLHN